MENFFYTIACNDGVHARPAGELVNFSKNNFKNIEVLMKFNNKTVSTKKLFDIMGLCLKKGDNVEFIIKEKSEIVLGEGASKIGNEPNLNSDIEHSDIYDAKQKLLDFLHKNSW